MDASHVSPLVIAAALSACAMEPESLNSERIEERFGSYGIEVLSHRAGIRRSSLYSLHDRERICRTYAVVQFVDASTPRVAGAHSQVLAGESIGATFKSTGWQIAKVSLHIGTVSLPGPGHAISELMHIDGSEEVGVHAYQLVLKKGTETINYATIVEAHHPDYLGLDELNRLYGDGIEAALSEKELRALSKLILDSAPEGLSDPRFETKLP